MTGIPDDILDVAAEIGLDEEDVRGDEHLFRCTVHGPDTTPSLQINEAKQEWYCFGCGVGGGIRQLVQHYAPDRVDDLIIRPALRPVNTDTGIEAQAAQTYVLLAEHAVDLPADVVTELDRAAVMLDDVAVLAVGRKLLCSA